MVNLLIRIFPAYKARKVMPAESLVPSKKSYALWWGGIEGVFHLYRGLSSFKYMF